MNARRSWCLSLAAVALFAFAGGCGSSDGSPAQDAAPDLPKASPDTPVVTPDGPTTIDTTVSRLDTKIATDVTPDANIQCALLDGTPLQKSYDECVAAGGLVVAATTDKPAFCVMEFLNGSMDDSVGFVPCVVAGGSQRIFDDLCPNSARGHTSCMLYYPQGACPTIYPPTPGDYSKWTHITCNDGGAAGQDGPTSEAKPVDTTGGPDGGATSIDTATVDAPLDVPADRFTPGPATPIVVNSGNTAVYGQGDGTWKVFYFDATADQLYCISKLSGIVRGYVSTSASVSPTNYQYATDSTTGTLAFSATAAQRYYIAVAVNGGGASGSFQVADGGQLLALGANAVTLPAPAADNYYYFRLPISAGHAYSISVTGPSTPSVGLAVSPRAERSSNGQFMTSPWGMSSPLPITNEPIATDSVALSYSGYYFFFLRVPSPMNVTVTLAQTS